jgi:hypothetical protein
MQLSSKERNLVLLGFLATAGLAYSFGRMTNYLGAPLTSAGAREAAGTGAAPGSGNGSGPSADGSGLRIGSSFATESAGSDEPFSISRVTGGQPLDEWLKKLMAQDDDLYRMQNLMKLVETLNSPEDLKAALEIIGTRRGRFSEYGLLMEKFTKVDPRAAIVYAGAQDGREKMAAVSAVLHTWTRTDPAAALAWAQTEGAAMPREGGRGPGVPAGPGGDRGPRENFAVSSVITQMARTDLDRALAAAGSPESGRPGGRVVETLASEMLSQRGADAARQAGEAIPEGDLKNGYLRTLAEKLAGKDAAGTAKWAMSWPAGETKNRALGQIMEEWAKSDATAAGTFLAAQPVSAETDSAREHYASHVLRKDPPGALSWANTITDPARREKTVTNLAMDWARRDPEPARQWIAQSTLPNDLKAKLAPTRNRRTRGPGGPAPK